MDFALSTRWNAGRHTDGRAMVEEILEMGFPRLELGYDLRMDLVPGVQEMIREGAVLVDSVHNFCPVPVGAPRGHPELFTFADKDPRIRQSAIEHTSRTIRFAQEVGAKVVVSHSGNVSMKKMSFQLLALLESGRHFSPEYERIRFKLQKTRDRKAPRQLAHLRRSLDQVMPVLEETGVVLALENLPTWEAFPTEMEITGLLQDYGNRGLRFWYDIGHGQIRHNMGLVNTERWLERLQPWLAGMHIHDVIPPIHDHAMPPRGQVDFTRLKPFATSDILRVFEPSPNTPREHLEEALAYVTETWGTPDKEPEQ